MLKIRQFVDLNTTLLVEKSGSIYLRLLVAVVKRVFFCGRNEKENIPGTLSAGQCERPIGVVANN